MRLANDLATELKTFGESLTALMTQRTGKAGTRSQQNDREGIFLAELYEKLGMDAYREARTYLSCELERVGVDAEHITRRLLLDSPGDIDEIIGTGNRWVTAFRTAIAHWLGGPNSGKSFFPDNSTPDRGIDLDVGHGQSDGKSIYIPPTRGNESDKLVEADEQSEKVQRSAELEDLKAFLSAPNSLRRPVRKVW